MSPEGWGSDPLAFFYRTPLRARPGRAPSGLTEAAARFGNLPSIVYHRKWRGSLPREGAVMLLSTRSHNRAGGNNYGPGGPRCPCCAPAPKGRRAERRRTKRTERNSWKKEWAV